MNYNKKANEFKKKKKKRANRKRINITHIKKVFIIIIINIIPSCLLAINKYQPSMYMPYITKLNTNNKE